MQDIGERKRVEAELRSQARFQETLSQALIHAGTQQMVLEDGRITYVGNRPLAHEFGFSDAMIDACPRLESILHPEDRERVLDYHRRRLAGEPVPGTYDLSLITLTGERREFEVTAYPIPDTQPPRLITVGKDVTERHRLKAAIERERASLRTFFDALPDLAWMKDTEGHYLLCNPMVERFFGATEAEIVGKTDFDYVDAELATHFRLQDMNAISAGKPRMNEEWVTFACDGRHALLETVKAPVHDKTGETVGVIGVAHDITERKRVERELKEAFEFVEDVIKAIPDLLFEVDRRGRYLNVWTCHQDLRTSQEAALGGRTIRDVLGADVAMAVIEDAKANGVAYGNTASFNKADGETRWYEYSLSRRSRCKRSETSFIVLWRDVTERVHMEHSLAAHAREFRSLIENLPDIIVRYDRDYHRTYVSPTYERLIGISSDVAIGKSPHEHLGIPTADQNTEDFRAHLTRAMHSGSPMTTELTWNRGDGETVLLDVRLIPEFDENGHTSGVLTVAQDVTAQRALEDRLRMTASVFDAAHEGIMITDTSYRIMDINPAFTRITGYSRDEAIGQFPILWSAGCHDKAFYRNMRSILRKQKFWSGEVFNKRKNGEVYPEQLDIAAVNHETNRVKYYVGIFSDITKIKQHEAYLQYAAYHDTLTGLPNRLLFSDRLSQAIAQANRSDRIVALLYLDLDGFKPINDNYCHEVGDHVLQEVARRLSTCVRASDTVARIGGDEFTVLFSGLSNARECEVLAHRLVETIAQPVMLNGLKLSLSTSMGISLYPDDESDADALLRSADQAMYRAKSAGRNQFVFHARESEKEGRHQGVLLRDDVRKALDEDQITVYYQPIVDMGSGRVVKAEALARWEHPIRGLIPPSTFIPIAEKGHLIDRIGDCVFTHAARVAQEWNLRITSASASPLRISVNRSPCQFAGSDGMNTWLRYLTDHNVPGELLSVEITESMLLDDRPEVRTQLKQLRDAGITVALDDFGTGYSALSYLKKFEIDCLKIDRSFIRDIATDASDRAIVEAIVLMATKLGIKLIAEGVETQEQAQLLAAAGCDMAQGYLYARPMPESEFLQFVLATEVA